MSETLHPERYVSGGIECADALDAMVSDWKDPVMAAHLWNAGKYIWRAPKKGDPVENLVKAANYILRDLHHLTMTGGRADVYQQIQNALDDYLFNEEELTAVALQERDLHPEESVWDPAGSNFACRCCGYTTDSPLLRYCPHCKRLMLSTDENGNPVRLTCERQLPEYHKEALADD